MSNNDNGDIFAAGFERLDEKYITKRPPKINWGMIYKDMPDAEKISYLEKLASSMNHAAALVQDERNELGRLCELKEGQIATMEEAVRQNNVMLQQEVTRMNTQRQDYNEIIKGLNQRIKELEQWQSSKESPSTGG
jgi:hypothetical protein